MIRMCHPSDFKGFLEYNEEQVIFGGTAGNLITEPMKVFAQGLAHAGLNATLKIEANIGVGSLDPATGKYDGCLGYIQANKSDMILQLFEYPVAGENLTEGLLVYDTILSIASAYRKVKSTAPAQIMSSFNSFSYQVWFLCALLTMAMSLVLKLRGSFLSKKKKKKVRDYSIFYTLTHCLRLHHMPHFGATRKLIYTSGSIFALIVVHCFLTLIKTELVVSRDPFLFESYQDIIDRHAMPIFIKGMGYDVLFKKEGIPRARRNLWQYAVKSFNPGDMYVQLDPLAFLISAIAVLEQEAVIVVEKTLIPVIPASGCPISARNPDKMVETLNMMGDQSRTDELMELASLEEDQRQIFLKFAHSHDKKYTSLPDILFHYSVDSNEKPFSQGIVLSSNSDRRVISSIKFVIRRAIETGISIYSTRQIEGFDILGDYHLLNLFVGPGIKSRKNFVDDCMSPTVLKASASFHALMASNYYILFLITAGLFVAGIIMFALEVSQKRQIDSCSFSAKVKRRKSRPPFPYRSNGERSGPLLRRYPY